MSAWPQRSAGASVKRNRGEQKARILGGQRGNAQRSQLSAALCLRRDPVGELTGTIFTACVGYLITYAGKSLGEKISRNRHGLDADGNPLPDPSGDTLNNEEAKG